MRKSLKNMLSAHGDLSTKRAAGLGGLIVIFLCYAYCCFTGLQMPDVTEFLSACCVTLLGIDPVTNIFKKDNTETYNADTDDESKRQVDTSPQEL